MARPATAAVRLLTGEREPVRVRSNVNITLSGLQTIDGVLLDVGDRVLVKGQTNMSEHGIYTASTGQWYRAADARTARTMQKGTTVHVQEGTVAAGFVYAFQTNNPVIGTDDIVLSFYQSDDTIGEVNEAIAAGVVSIGAAGAAQIASIGAAADAEIAEVQAAGAPIVAAAEAARDDARDAASDAAASASALGNQVHQYDTRTLALAATVPAGVNAVRLLGYGSAGDGGHALYKRAASEPSHAGKFQSADGAWWELAEIKPHALMFGCKFDNATDDYAKLQGAFDYAAGNALWLPAGIGLLSQDIDVPSDTAVYGIRGKTWLKALAGSTSNPYLMTINGKTNVLIRGVGFDGNIANVSAQNNTVLTYSSSNVWFDQCLGKNTKGITFAFTGNADFEDCRVTRCKFNNCGQYHLTSLDANDRKDCVWFGGAGGGAGKNLVVDDCDFKDTGLAHVSFSGSVARGLSKIRVTDCRMARSDAGCIYFSSISDVVCEGNIIAGCDGNGIDTIDMFDFVIAGNIVRDCTGAGIGAFGSCKRGSITGNTCLDNFAHDGWAGDQVSVHRGGITFHVVDGDVCETVLVAGNTSMDTRTGTDVTQRFAIGVIKEGTGIFKNIKVAASNILKGYSALGAESTQYRFQTFDLGLQDISATIVLQPDAVVAICPTTESSRIGLFCANTNVPGDIQVRNGVAPLLVYEATAGNYLASDTGSNFAVYASGTDIVLKNRNAAARSISLQRTQALT